MSILYSGFLYFPEDKTAYIPAAIEFLIILLLCIGAFMLFKHLSKKQEMKTKALEERVLRERQQQMSNHQSHS
ncbi:hypothetical protein D1B33_10610 [Lysinibacillus yapensis]|uniref:Uncharacterized protein n=1 Tax=Ureibacillus yapensis TaxID=2304605 RepID=A0A396SF17_9BACL|nr:hypothetical protein [Lysinibacillus yapensis]RHW36832.1 hypothetical protein D1B33_10610 [Lysinibacillus yapensis]